MIKQTRIYVLNCWRIHNSTGRPTVTRFDFVSFAAVTFCFCCLLRVQDSMCKPRLSTQLIPIKKSTQTRSTSVSGQISGTSTSFTTSTILQLSKLNVERDLPTHFNTNYTGDVNGHSPLCGYHDHNSTTWHFIEDMFTASNLIFM